MNLDDEFGGQSCAKVAVSLGAFAVISEKQAGAFHTLGQGVQCKELGFAPTGTSPPLSLEAEDFVGGPHEVSVEAHSLGREVTLHGTRVLLAASGSIAGAPQLQSRQTVRPVL
jgi:hypothetical protein